MDNAEVINIHMQGGAMGNLSSAIFEGEQKSLRELARSEKNYGLLMEKSVGMI